jgi:hypothetical protein
VDRFWHVSPWISRAALCFAALDFGAVGFAYLTEPAIMAWNYGISVFTATAATSMRVAFGGYPLAITLIAFFCLLFPQRFLMGLTVAATVSGMALAARAFGVVVDGADARNLLMMQREMISFCIYAIGVAVEWRRRALQTAPSLPARLL